MKLNLLLTMALPIAMYAQDTIAVGSTGEYPNTFSSGSSNVERFDNNARKYNDWAISVGGGGAFMQSADLTSFYDDKINWGWNAYVSLDKQISHTFGLSLQYNFGETNQKGVADTASWEEAVYNYNGTVVDAGDWGVGVARTRFHQINLLGDINFSNLLRRVDNKSPYRWALHGYAGIGLEGYKATISDNSNRWNNPETIKQDLDIASFYFMGGLGLKYKISRRLDIEARTMYHITGDDEFDGGGWKTLW